MIFYYSATHTYIHENGQEVKYDVILKIMRLYKNFLNVNSKKIDTFHNNRVIVTLELLIQNIHYNNLFKQIQSCIRYKNEVK